jgi:hypothetical protein
MNTKRSVLLLVLITALTGCIGGTSVPASFYLLEPIAATVSKLDISPKIVIALTPVRIPEYADRSQIVSGIAKNSYKINESQRWAEPLDKNITRVLVQNLSQLVPAEVILSNTSNLAKLAKIKVSVTLLEFYVDPQGQARVTAQWLVAQGENQLLNKQVAYQAAASTSDYTTMVAALNDCINQMSLELAMVLQQVAR